MDQNLWVPLNDISHCSYRVQIYTFTNDLSQTEEILRHNESYIEIKGKIEDES